MKSHHRKLLIACLTCFKALTASAADLVWTNTAGGNWTTAANWSPNQVPSIADDVFITNNGSYTVTMTPGSYSANSVVIGGGLGSQSLTIGTINGSYSFTLNTSGFINSNGQLSLSRGTMTGNANITNAGVFNWTEGTMSGSGQTINALGGTLNISGECTLSRVLHNNGSAIWLGNASFIFNNGTFNNAGSVTVSNSAQKSFLGSGTAVFNNSGTFNKLGNGELQFSASAGGVTFNNSGTFHVASGAWMRLLAGGNHSGDFALALNSSGLSLSGNHTFAASCDITGPGYLDYSGPGTSTCAGTVDLGGALLFYGGTFTFTGPVSGGNLLRVSGGTINFNGATTLSPGTALD